MPQRSFLASFCILSSFFFYPDFDFAKAAALIAFPSRRVYDRPFLIL